MRKIADLHYLKVSPKKEFEMKIDDKYISYMYHHR